MVRGGAVTAPARTMTITAVARSVGLSRSTLLYYDRIGLLRPSLRSTAGYRLYAADDLARLRRICELRDAGVPLDEIAALLDRGCEPAAVLSRQLDRTAAQMTELQARRAVLAAMLGVVPRDGSRVDREVWTAMFRAIGLDDAAMLRWHAEFERHAPTAHRAFLQSLGMADDEIDALRLRCDPANG
jgi:MerR family transcriptional regulator, thiopeptide resistance regulator